MENEKPIEYVQVQAPDIIRLGEYVTRAKGINRTMAQFAEECGVGASTLSRIANGKIRKPLSEDVIRAIYEHRDPKSGVSLDLLMRLNGFRDKDAYEKRSESYAREIGRREEILNRERKMKNTIVTALLDRNVPVVRIREIIGNRKSGEPYEHPIWFDFAFEVEDAVEKEWYFETFPQQGADKRQSPVLTDRLMTRANRIFLQDAWSPMKFMNKKISFLFCDERIFEYFLALYERAPIQCSVTAILIDTDAERIVKEKWMSSKPETPSVLLRPVQYREEDPEMEKIFYRPEEYIDFQNEYWRKPNE